MTTRTQTRQPPLLQLTAHELLGTRGAERKRRGDVVGCARWEA